MTFDFSELKNKTVLLTGGSSGIGEAQLQAFLACGAHVGVLDIKSSPLIEANQGKSYFRFFPCNLADEKEIAVAHENFVAHFGAVDILLNTAGILDDYKTVEQTSLELWDLVMQTNLRSMYQLIALVLPQMQEQKAGVIINMASIAGLVAGGGGVAYTAAKHAIIGLTKQVALDYAPHGIRCNTIAPGAIQTPMNAADFLGDGTMAQWVADETPAKRWAKAEEVADLSLFLASRHAAYLHGATVPIDGGWTIK